MSTKQNTLDGQQLSDMLWKLKRFFSPIYIDRITGNIPKQINLYTLQGLRLKRKNKDLCTLDELEYYVDDKMIYISYSTNNKENRMEIFNCYYTLTKELVKELELYIKEYFQN
jgi:hypothetical protein